MSMSLSPSGCLGSVKLGKLFCVKNLLLLFEEFGIGTVFLASTAVDILDYGSTGDTSLASGWSLLLAESLCVSVSTTID